MALRSSCKDILLGMVAAACRHIPSAPQLLTCPDAQLNELNNRLVRLQRQKALDIHNRGQIDRRVQREEARIQYHWDERELCMNEELNTQIQIRKEERRREPDMHPQGESLCGLDGEQQGNQQTRCSGGGFDMRHG